MDVTFRFQFYFWLLFSTVITIINHYLRGCFGLNLNLINLVLFFNIVNIDFIVKFIDIFRSCYEWIDNISSLFIFGVHLIWDGLLHWLNYWKINYHLLASMFGWTNNHWIISYHTVRYIYLFIYLVLLSNSWSTFQIIKRGPYFKFGLIRIMQHNLLLLTNSRSDGILMITAIKFISNLIFMLNVIWVDDGITFCVIWWFINHF